MQMIYNSPNYCIVEFGAVDGSISMQAGGYEIVDKALKREIFLDGALAAHFREDVRKLIESEPTAEEVDAFLAQFDGVMTHPVLLH